MSPSAAIELSGLHWNSVNNRLYAVQNDGRLRVLQYDASGGTFSQIANKSFDGGPEGITQVDLSANEVYTIDENEYEIRKYTHNASFSTLTESRHWNLLQAPSPMPDTGNTGPEGIAFVPDSFLADSNFTSSVTGQPYVSTKGMGGLMFVAHQDGGYIWVFDLNPDVNNDFAYVGKYKTSRSESCDLAFDRSTGLLYILHNVGSNYLQVTNMSLAPAPGSEPTFSTLNEYFIANPTGSNTNVEGFALMPKCGDLTGSAFLCRDASSSEALSVRQDVLRWFAPFLADGNCELSVNDPNQKAVIVYPNPTAETLFISGLDSQKANIAIFDLNGKLVKKQQQANSKIDVSKLAKGEYILKIDNGNSTQEIKFIKD